MTVCGTRVAHDGVVSAKGAGTAVPAGGAAAATQSGAGVVSGGTTAAAAGSDSAGGGTAGTGTAAPGQTAAAGNGAAPGATTTAAAGPGNGGSRPTGGSTGTAGAQALPPGSGGIPGNIITASCNGTATGTIKLGNVQGYSGVGGASATPARQMLNLWASYINGHGGICGRKVQLFIKDDQGSASQTAADVKDLVENQHVVAFVNQGTATTLAAQQSYLESKHVPVIGGDLATGAWFSSPVFFPEGANSGEQYVAMFKAGHAYPNGTKVAMLYCSEVAACEDQRNYIVNRKL